MYGITRYKYIFNNLIRLILFRWVNMLNNQEVKKNYKLNALDNNI